MVHIITTIIYMYAKTCDSYKIIITALSTTLKLLNKIETLWYTIPCKMRNDTINLLLKYAF